MFKSYLNNGFKLTFNFPLTVLLKITFCGHLFSMFVCLPLQNCMEISNKPNSLEAIFPPWRDTPIIFTLDLTIHSISSPRTSQNREKPDSCLLTVLQGFLWMYLSTRRTWARGVIFVQTEPYEARTLKSLFPSRGVCFVERARFIRKFRELHQTRISRLVSQWRRGRRFWVEKHSSDGWAH